MTTEQFWLSIGFLGQGFFFSRFLVQWIASERKRESVIPISFWFFSIGGGFVLLIYAIQRADPVFILGQGAGLLGYLRNLYLIRRKQRQLAQAGPSSPPPKGHRPHQPGQRRSEQVGHAPDPCNPDDPRAHGAALPRHPDPQPAAHHPLRPELRPRR